MFNLPQALPNIILNTYIWKPSKDLIFTCQLLHFFYFGRFYSSGWPSVLCYQLGYHGSEYAVYANETDPDYQSSYPINFQSPACNPRNSDTVAECNQDDDFSCDHDLDVYVECNSEYFHISTRYCKILLIYRMKSNICKKITF